MGDCQLPLAGSKAMRD